MEWVRQEYYDDCTHDPGSPKNPKRKPKKYETEPDQVRFFQRMQDYLI